jgi:hypothetical protein
MSVLGDIEKALSDILLTIDGSEQTFPGYATKYTFNTKTASVNIYDDVVGVVTDKIKGGVNYNIEMDYENNTEYEIGANCYSNIVDYIITAEVKNIEKGNTKALIYERMNQVLEDIKWVLFRYNTLNNTCFGVTYKSSKRAYTNGNDMINSGKIIINISVQYGQHGSNPSIVYNNNFLN